MLALLLTSTAINPPVAGTMSTVSEAQDAFQHVFDSLAEPAIRQDPLPADPPVVLPEPPKNGTPDQAAVATMPDAVDRDLPVLVQHDASAGPGPVISGAKISGADPAPGHRRISETLTQRLVLQMMSDQSNVSGMQPDQGGKAAQMLPIPLVTTGHPPPPANDFAFAAPVRAEAGPLPTATAVTTGAAVMPAAASPKMGVADPRAHQAWVNPAQTKLGGAVDPQVQTRLSPAVAGNGDIAPMPAAAVVPRETPAPPVCARETRHSAVPTADMPELPFSLSDRSAAVISATTIGGSVAPETARQVAQQLAVSVTSQSAGTTEIALNPEELGRVRMTMSASDGAMMLQISAERPETADLLRRYIEMLAQEFRALGYSDISFSFGDEPSSDPEEDQAHKSMARPDDDLGPADPETPRPPLAHGTLDLRL